MLFLIKVVAGEPPVIADFAEDQLQAYDMILNLCSEQKILSVIDDLDLPETQDGIHLLKINKNEYMKIVVATCEGFLYNSKDFERKEKYFITTYSPVKEKHDVMEKIVKELNLTTKKSKPINISYNHKKKKYVG